MNRPLMDNQTIQAFEIDGAVQRTATELTFSHYASAS